MAEQNKNGQELELEAELSCSICTDVLYHPLTLLDCLHTFCGSCLKEWFSWQASSAATTGRGYSCPACRAPVRDTRPNATVTTLLEMFLKAHPERGKTSQDKTDMDKIYKPGDNVIPPFAQAEQSEQDDSEDERILAQTRALSLNQTGHRRLNQTTSQRPDQATNQSLNQTAGQRHNDAPLSHQSSLRSLLSASDLDSGDMEEEIMRHIIEQGLLDGIDLNNLTPAQEDQITDSIARAFRSRRQRERSGRRNRPRHRQSPTTDANAHAHSHSHSNSRSHPQAHAHSPSHSQSQARSPSHTHSQSLSHAHINPQPTPSRRRAASANHDSPLHNQLLAPESRSRPSNHSTPALPTSPDQDPSETASLSSVTCSHCQTQGIEYSLHYNCSKCLDGNFNLCLACYRAAKGCLNWYGFGHQALSRYQTSAPTHQDRSDRPPPHVLSARRYHQGINRLDQGLFCEGCFAFANACYWHCDVCNDGAWGFCNACVQQGKHCIHPLASVAHVSLAPSPNQSSQPSSNLYPQPLNSPAKSAFHFSLPTMALLPHVLDPSMYKSITPASYCYVCRYSIPPSQARFHCNICNEGNYNICTPCYNSLVNTARISPENGPQGWRRCLRAHRMSLIGYEDREGGSRRIVVKEIVGGWALKEETMASLSKSAEQWRWRESDGTSASQPSSRSLQPNMMPPDGGVGLRTQAMWSYFPSHEVWDELSFPRNAIITEAEDINGDWYWGVYAGRKGLFPGNYVRII